MTPDARGVVLGQKGLVLFPSLDRLVAFLRAYSEEGSLDELLPSLEIRHLVTPLHTRELTLFVQAESSYRMDRLAGVARVAGGMVFTGTQRHFVKYRDAASPLGYDVQELVDQAADLILYHDSFRQTYTFRAELPFRDLVFRLSPQRLPPQEQHVPARLFATAEPGVGHALMSYLFRWQVSARAGLAEWPADSAFEDRPKRLHVFDVRDVPERIARLFETLPGVHLFEPLNEAVGVQLGYRHPLALESCASLFEREALYLFRADGEVTRIDPLPPFVPVRSLVRVEVRSGEEPAAHGVEPGSGHPVEELSLRLRLAPSPEPWRAVVATIVPLEQRQWLARLLYALPPHTLQSLQMAVGDGCFYLVDPSGIEGLPLGTFYSEVATRIYVPAGMTLVPAVSPSVLEELIRGRGDGHVFFDPKGAGPHMVPSTAFGPVSRRALREVAAVTVHADRPSDGDPSLPLLTYDKPRWFPLWGAPGKEERDEVEGDSEDES